MRGMMWRAIAISAMPYSEAAFAASENAFEAGAYIRSHVRST